MARKSRTQRRTVLNSKATGISVRWWQPRSLGLVTPVQAHHSFAIFDAEQTKVFTGVVTRVNPDANHLQIFFAPMNAERKNVERGPDGKPVIWAVEMDGSAQAATMGISVNSFPPGTVFSVALHPLRSGEPAGSRRDTGAHLQVPGEDAAGGRQELRLRRRPHDHRYGTVAEPHRQVSPERLMLRLRASGSRPRASARRSSRQLDHAAAAVDPHRDDRHRVRLEPDDHATRGRQHARGRAVRDGVGPLRAVAVERARRDGRSRRLARSSASRCASSPRCRSGSRCRCS